MTLPGHSETEFRVFSSNFELHSDFCALDSGVKSYKQQCNSLPKFTSTTCHVSLMTSRHLFFYYNYSVTSTTVSLQFMLSISHPYRAATRSRTKTGQPSRPSLPHHPPPPTKGFAYTHSYSCTSSSQQPAKTLDI
jgi:hypothetical protein